MVVKSYACHNMPKATVPAHTIMAATKPRILTGCALTSNIHRTSFIKLLNEPRTFNPNDDNITRSVQIEVTEDVVIKMDTARSNIKNLNILNTVGRQTILRRIILPFKREI